MGHPQVTTVTIKGVKNTTLVLEANPQKTTIITIKTISITRVNKAKRKINVSNKIKDPKHERQAERYMWQVKITR